MIASAYNTLVPYGSDYLLHNQTYGAILRLKEHQKIQVERILSSGQGSGHLYQKLVELGFLVSSRRDEFDFLHNQYQSGIQSSVEKSLTITVTDQCNLACDYCFEEKSQWKKMSPETQAQVVDFADRLLDSSPTNNFSVTWYGGEPGLHLKCVYSLSKQLVALADKRKVGYRAIMVTNGTVLTEQVCRSLLAHRIRKLQVTIDGKKSDHDRSRPFLAEIDPASASPAIKKQYEKIKKSRSLPVIGNNPPKRSSSYDRIIEGVTCYTKLGGTVSLRMNVTEETFDGIFETLEDLYNRELLRTNDRGGLLYVNVQPVHETPLTAGCGGCHVSTLKKSRFAKKLSEVREWHKNHGIEEFLPKINLRFTGDTCIANEHYSYVINPDGSLTTCSQHVCDEQYVSGHVTDAIQPSLKSMDDAFNTFDPFTNEECSQCEVLPICVGGCKANNITNTKDGGGYEAGCSVARFSLKHNIIQAYEDSKTLV